MIAYHLDHCNKLQEGECLLLTESPHLVGDPVADLYGFDKVSYWGKRCYEYLRFGPQITTLDMLNSSQIDLQAEVVRKNWFPSMPSRFKSIFAVTQLSDFNFWVKFLSITPNSNIFEIEYDPSKCAKLDASFLKGGIDCDPMRTFPILSQYWSGEMSSSPLPELLIPLPVTIGRRVTSNELVSCVRFFDS